MAQETLTAQPMPEMTPMQEPSLVDRVRNGLIESWDQFTHPVSREAQAQLQTIAAQLEGTPVATTLGQIEPHLRELLRSSDASAMAAGIMARVLLLGTGVALFHGGLIRGRGSLLARGIYGIFGATAIGLGLQNNVEVFPARQLIQSRAGRLKMFYATDAGRADAANPDKTSAQVDAIVRAVTMGHVPSVSRP